MKEYTIKYDFIIKYTLLIALLLVCCEGLYTYIIPEYRFSALTLIPIYFYSFGLLIAIAYALFRKFANKWITHFYLLCRGVKFLISISILLIYTYQNKSNPVAFMLTFMIYYFLTMFFELWFFCGKEMSSRKNLLKVDYETDN